jgi:flagellar basal-body rod modification protein FlgD
MPSVSSISNLSNAAGTTPQDTAANPSQVLNQQDFLQLLVSQMQNQDPLNPQSDTEMAAQMAQFTSLTQSSQMAGSLSMLQANSLIGSTVNLQVNSQTTTSGVVTGVVENNGQAQVQVNGASYNLNQVLSVMPPIAAPAGSTSAPTTTP